MWLESTKNVFESTCVGIDKTTTTTFGADRTHVKMRNLQWTGVFYEACDANATWCTLREETHRWRSSVTREKQYEAKLHIKKMSNTLFVHKIVEAYRNWQKEEEPAADPAPVELHFERELRY